MTKYDQILRNGDGFVYYYKSVDSTTTKLPSGKTDFRAQNPLRWSEAKNTFAKPALNPASGTNVWPPNCSSALSAVDSRWISNAEQQALAKFRGKLKKGGASLGITIATYSQSRGMILDALGRVSSSIAGLEKSLLTKRGRRKYRNKLREKSVKGVETRASDVLAVKFGWGPLVEDIHAASRTLVQDATAGGEFIVGRAKVSYSAVRGSGLDVSKVNATVKSTVSSHVEVQNPNLWLASRAGVLNPAQIALDYIPWSWVVGMFVNLNAFIGQTTDYAGLKFSKQAVTNTQFVYEEGQYRVYGGGIVQWRHIGRVKNRDVGSLPTVALQFRIPDLDMALAITASALVLQKVKKLDRLVTKILS